MTGRHEMGQRLDPTPVPQYVRPRSVNRKGRPLPEAGDGRPAAGPGALTEAGRGLW